MLNCCNRKSQVSSQMYSTRLMGDTCFNNMVDKNISSFLCSFMSYGLPLKHCDLPENCYVTKLISRLFKSVHLKHHKVSIMLWTKTCNLHKAFLGSFRPYELTQEHCGLPENCYFKKSKTRYFSIMSIYSNTFVHIGLREYAILSDAFKFQRLCENEM